MGRPLEEVYATVVDMTERRRIEAELLNAAPLAETDLLLTDVVIEVRGTAA